MKSLNKILNSTAALLLVITCCITSCSKEDVSEISFGEPLPAGSVSIKKSTVFDTANIKLSVVRDSMITVRLSAIAAQKLSGRHLVEFGIDSTKLPVFQLKYGSATLYPASSYFVFKKTAVLTADSVASTQVEFNLISQTKLQPMKTYVLPLSIISVDNNSSAIDMNNNTFYLVIKTGKSPVLDKTGWSIVSFSSQLSANYSPEKLLDKDLSTFWFSDQSKYMPQYVTVDMKSDHNLNGILFTNYQNLTYGGYPLTVNIQTSVDGISWQDKGNFNCAAVITQQTLPFADTNARYFKFTVLTCQLYNSSSQAVLITEIDAKANED